MRKAFLGKSIFIGLIVLSGCATTQDRTINLKRAAGFNAEMGTRYLAQGELDIAKVKFEKALKQDASLPKANAGYGLLMSQLGESSTADKHFKKALKKDPYNSHFLNNYGAFLYRQDRFKKAEKSFLEALKDPLYKTPEFAYTNAGRCRLRMGDEDSAENYFNKALKTNQYFPDALQQLAKLYYRRGQFDLAYASMRKFEKFGTQTPDSLWMLSGLASRMGDKNKAASYRLLLKSRFPDSEQAAQIRSIGN